MGITAEDWVNIKWVMAFVAACLLYAMGDLNGGLMAGLALGVLIPVTDIAQRLGVVTKD